MRLIVDGNLQNTINDETVFETVVRDWLCAIGSPTSVLIEYNLDSANWIVRHRPVDHAVVAFHHRLIGQSGNDIPITRRLAQQFGQLDPEDGTDGDQRANRGRALAAFH